jgi:hypothetical protein
MPDPLDISFAELEFLLDACPTQAPAVRERLRLGPAPEPGTRALAIAGLASLLLRGLCTIDGDSVRPEAPALAVIAALATSHTHIEAAGWNGDGSALMHLFSGPSVLLALLPGAYGCYSVHFFNSSTPPSGPLTQFLDACAAQKAEGAVLFQSKVDGDGAGVRLAVAVDDTGDWHLSDSVDTPRRGEPISRDGALRRIAELFDIPVPAVAN